MRTRSLFCVTTLAAAGLRGQPADRAQSADTGGWDNAAQQGNLGNNSDRDAVELC